MLERVNYKAWHRMLLSAAMLSLVLTGSTLAQTTAFTYQGKLTDGGNPANGSYDLQFALFDSQSGGIQVGPTLTRTAVSVSAGTFTVQLDYGASHFSGADRFLEISVRPAGAASFTVLAPRQPITSTPYAVRSLNATSADGLSVACLNCVTSSQIQNVLGSQVSGAIPVASLPAGSGNYIQNTTSQQASSNFNISGNGIVGGSLGIGTTPPQSKLQVDGEFVLFNTIGDPGGPVIHTGISGAEQNLYLHLINSPFFRSASGLKAGGILVADTYTYADPGKNDLIVKGKVGIGLQNLSGSRLSVVEGAGTADAITGIGTGNNVGVHGRTDSAYGVLGSVSGMGYAGYFMGPVHVSGTLSKTAGSFKIDHPLDPANKYLYHSFVESPDMMNIYNGNVTTDEKGEATVKLPDYFEALNQDYRYQLTVIGQFAQAIVSHEIKNNRFTIKTDKPQVKVSWQVTGIRHDAYANANRIPVEQDKPEKERGYFLHPQLFGQPEEKAVEWARDPERMRRLKQQRTEIKTQNKPK